MIALRSKIGGKHSTILGSKKGLNLLLGITTDSKVKKIILGRTGAKGGSIGKGLRAKVTTVDERGNIKLILSEGSSSQEIYIVTNLSNYEEGLIFSNKIKKSIEM